MRTDARMKDRGRPDYGHLLRGTIRRYARCLVPTSRRLLTLNPPIEIDEPITTYLVQMGADRDSIAFYPPPRGTFFTRIVRYNGFHVAFSAIPDAHTSPRFLHMFNTTCYIKKASLSSYEPHV